MKITKRTLISITGATMLLTVAAPAATPIALWEFNGNYLNSGNSASYNLTPNGGVTLVPSPRGMAAEFHGGTYPITNPSTYSNPGLDRLDTTAAPNNIFFNGGFSIVGWIKVDAANAGVVLGHDSSSYRLSDYGFSFSASSTISLKLRDTLDRRSGVTANGSPIAGNQWYHVAATWAGSNSDAFALYIDGQPVSQTVSHLGNFQGLNGSNPLPIRVGADEGDSVQNTHAFHGSIDHLSLYSGVLTPSEIQAHYSTTIPEPSAAVFGVIGILTFALRRIRNGRNG